MVVLAALVLAAVFGAGDQYLGSLSWHPWAADVSLLSAPWLVLAFLAGCTQRARGRAVALGFACTVAALVGYGLMTLSPVEHADLTVRTVSGFVHSEARVIVGSFVTGPLFGWLGWRWHTRHAWVGALATAAAVSLEPFVRIPAGRQIRYPAVSAAEVAAGVAMALYVAAAAHRTAVGRRA